jgi:hypothetical protein
MIISIHQPQYLPWDNFFKKIKKSDCFIFLDNVEFQKNGLQNRNQIKTSNGPIWLTVPIKQKLGQKISDVEIDNSKDWKKKHWKTISENYNKSKHFDSFKGNFQNIFLSNWNNLSELNIKIILEILMILNIKTKIYKASDLKVKGKSTELLVNLCKKINSKTYMSGEGGKNYLELEKFKEAGIQVIFEKNINQKPYKQNHDNVGFVQNLSIIDNLFNNGKEALEI